MAAIGWSARRRALVGLALAGFLLVPGVSTLWTAYQKFVHPSPPDTTLLSITGLGALAVNLFCAFRLARFRAYGGSLTRAAFLSARNDVLANVAIILAGAITVIILSPWPDLVVGLGIFFINLDAAREIFSAARDEHHTATQAP